MDGAPRAQATTTKTIVVVNGDVGALDLRDPALGSGRFEMVFLGSADGAYTDITRLRPDLVILFTNVTDTGGLRLLTMLKMDPRTRAIPVLTYTDDGEAPPLDAAAAAEDHDLIALAVPPPPRMN